MSVNNYKDFLTWTTEQIDKILVGTQTKNSFVKLLLESPENAVKEIDKYLDDLTERDILRFMVAKFYNISPKNIEMIYRESKKSDGVLMLRKIIYSN